MNGEICLTKQGGDVLVYVKFCPGKQVADLSYLPSTNISLRDHILILMTWENN